LRPAISGLPQFDRLLETWLKGESEELKEILLTECDNSEDRKLVSNAFYIAPELDIPLAQEFGLDPNEPIFKEGKQMMRLHLTKERNRQLVNRAKESWHQSSNGKLQCEVCGFSFPDTYGKVGAGFIEAHHRVPIASLNVVTTVNVADLAPVCSNCHSMLHRHRPLLTIEELRKIIQKL
jgi:hypothetical protein